MRIKVDLAFAFIDRVGRHVYSAIKDDELAGEVRFKFGPSGELLKVESRAGDITTEYRVTHPAPVPGGES